ncbi:MAG: protoporphyrinogen oxidase [Balneolaceae bacterium]|nr:protoporphyrinogen oxidase [Balneolaceae bacterium]
MNLEPTTSPGTDAPKPPVPRDGPSVGVVGGGISGLTAARILSEGGARITLYEKQPRVGGLIRTRASAGWQVDEGPNTLLLRGGSRAGELVRDLGLEERLQEAEKTASRRYILRDGRPQPLPSSPGEMISTGLLSAGAKLRLLAEPFARRGENPDESVASFFRRRLGPEVVDYAVNPFVGGIWAGDPEQLVMRHSFRRLWEMEQQYGSLLAGGLASLFGGVGDSKGGGRRLVSFAGGMQELPHALAEATAMELLTGADVRTLRRTRGSGPGGGRREHPGGAAPARRRPGWEVSFRREGENRTRTHQALVLACPPPVIAQMSGMPDLPRLPAAPVSVLATGFRREQVDHPLDGFGLLIPERESLSPLGTLFSSTLFPGRAPDGHVLLTTFAGGARQPELASRSTGKLRGQLLADLAPILGISGDPVFVSHTFWEAAIPQYTAAYGELREALTQMERDRPGLFACGNFVGGVSLPDCMETAAETAARVLSFLDSQGA